MKRYSHKRVQSKAQAAKTKFRRSAKWTKFRRALKAAQKVDPVTGSKLTPTCNVHHLDLNAEHYEDLSDETHFVALNKVSHETVHFIYNAAGGWRNAIAALTDICERMEAINGEENRLQQECERDSVGMSSFIGTVHPWQEEADPEQAGT